MNDIFCFASLFSGKRVSRKDLEALWARAEEDSRETKAAVRRDQKQTAAEDLILGELRENGVKISPLTKSQ